MRDNWCHLLLSVVLAWCLVDGVMGWGFSIRTTTFAEGALGEFEITNDDGGGYTFPYTMTVFKQAPDLSDEQVGIVYANKTVFEWWCNQPAGSNIWFRLMSAAAVNEATSRYYRVRPGAQATISSISTMSIASTAGLSQTSSSTQPTPDTESPSSLHSSPKGIPTGAIAGAVGHTCICSKGSTNRYFRSLQELCFA
ncbi:hypothetical protein BDV93DRAFT_257760 [Ceratobasidium sp. AG-I]|nr:hypothetical protein BDV93DRAFT_257760 [Ceratobasidium sp. AG-I]